MAKPLTIKGGVMGHSKLRATGELLQQQQAFMTSWLDISSTGDDDNDEEEEKKATEEPLE